jgi:uncharacterized membrane protein
MPRLVYVWDRLRGSFWFVPAICAAGAVILAMVLLSVDRRLEDRLSEVVWFYGGGAEGARSLLSALAGSIITVLGLAFSITTVALQLAAAQLGPRLLRNFVRDPGNQIVLGTFVGTFAYCLVVLRAIRGQSGVVNDAFVPQLSVTAALLLGMLSVGVLIYFIHHAAVSMQADHVIATVAAELDGAIDGLFPERLGHDIDERDDASLPSEPPADEQTALPSPGSGYVQSIETERLVDTAARHDIVVRLACRPGDFVAEGDAIARSWPASKLTPEVAGNLTESVVLGLERTMLQDALFGVEQLVEIAINGLSSSARDPLTAVRCVDRLGAAVGRVADRAMPSPLRRDGQGRLRVIAPAPTIDDFVSVAFDAVRGRARESRLVCVRLLETFTRLVRQHPRRRRLHAALLQQALAVVRGSETLGDPLDRGAVAHAYQDFVRAVAHEPAGRFDDPHPPLAPAA